MNLEPSPGQIWLHKNKPLTHRVKVLKIVGGIITVEPHTINGELEYRDFPIEFPLENFLKYNRPETKLDKILRDV